MHHPDIGVVIVSYNSADVILECLETLLGAARGRLRVVVIDNASTDDTCAAIRAWATGNRTATLKDLPFTASPITKPLALDGSQGLLLVEAPRNTGFAGGVNQGLTHLENTDYVWVLNPDCTIPASGFETLFDHLSIHRPEGLIGGRITYMHPATQIQSDGGTIRYHTGVTGNLNLYATDAKTPPPEPTQIDFIPGASMIASRRFLEHTGPMCEDYFLYYEEVDWALRRGVLPLHHVPGFKIYHHGGTAIGSPIVARLASPFSLYFKHRARMMFVRRFRARALPLAYLYSLALIIRMLLKREPGRAWAIFTALHHLPAPPAVRRQLTPETQRRAFPRQRALDMETHTL